MNSSTLRRLASEFAAFEREGVPPYYFWRPWRSYGSPSMSENIFQLRILFAGPDGTPYADGVWRVELTMPSDYPQSPPKVEFETRIWHPNVGAPIQTVCLKRYWEPSLTIRDALSIVSRLIIQPNLDSAINPAAAQLFQEDYQAFCDKVKPMVKKHAPVVGWLIDFAREANDRGKGKPRREVFGGNVPANRNVQQLTKVAASSRPTQSNEAHPSDSEDDEASASKENNPALSLTPVTAPLPNPRRPALGKRPLSDLPTPVDTEANDNDEAPPLLSPSEQNIANNAPPLLPSAFSNALGNPQRRLQAQRITKMNSRLNSTVPQSATRLATSTTGDHEVLGQQPPSKRLRSTEGKKKVSATTAAKAGKSTITMPKSAIGLAVPTTGDRKELYQHPPSERLRFADGKKNVNAAAAAAAAARVEKSTTTTPQSATGLTIPTTRDRKELDPQLPSKRLRSIEGKADVSAAAKVEKSTAATLSRTRSGQVPGMKNAANNSRKVPSTDSATKGSKKEKPRVGLRRL